MPRVKRKPQNIPEISLDDKIADAEEKIHQLTEELKKEKKGLKKLLQEKAEQEKNAAAKKAEEDAAVIVQAFTESGKNVEDVLAFLQQC